ncbi:MAG TPA: dihydropteroate synthase [Acidimicrobiales bacterium]|nr:dihydropteroate synthase [Acidimicrobiales bacterium]
MGVLNVTPDSFFAPSRAPRDDAAIALGRSLVSHGAGILDVGGESTRPGATPVDVDVELDRVLPVLHALAGSCRLSVDTVKPQVARAAVAAGATLLNDVSGALGPLAAELGVGWVSMHHRGIPAARTGGMGSGAVAEVAAHVLAGARAARDAGVDEVYVDPGFGFGKDVADNLALLAHLAELCRAAHDEGFGVLVGASRKRFLGALPNGGPLEAEDRFEGSLATAVYAMTCGADVVRVHDVEATVQAASLVADGEAA